MTLTESVVGGVSSCALHVALSGYRNLSHTDLLSDKPQSTDLCKHDIRRYASYGMNMSAAPKPLTYSRNPQRTIRLDETGVSAVCVLQNPESPRLRHAELYRTTCTMGG